MPRILYTALIFLVGLMPFGEAAERRVNTEAKYFKSSSKIVKERPELCDEASRGKQASRCFCSGC